MGNQFLVGWGTVRPGKQDLLSTPMKVEVPVVRTDQCKNIYRKIRGFEVNPPFEDNIICAGIIQGGKYNCHGDLGGPLMAPIAQRNGSSQFYQFGIVSWTVGCIQQNVPSINTKVQFYAAWIQEKLKLKIKTPKN